MKMAIIMASAVVALAAGAARAAQPEDEAVLHVYSTDDELWSIELVEGINPTPGSERVRATGAGELAAVLRQYARAGVPVRRLIISGDGGGSGPLITPESLPRLAGAAGAFAPGAEIVFHASGAAQGEEGVAFLRRAAKTLLPRGGRIVAPAGDYVRPSVPQRAGAVIAAPAAGLPGMAAGAAALTQEGVSPLGYLQIEADGQGAVSTRYLFPGVGEAREQIVRQLEQIGVPHEKTRAAARLIADVVGPCGVNAPVLAAADLATLQKDIDGCLRMAARAAQRAAPAAQAVLPFVAPVPYLVGRAAGEGYSGQEPSAASWIAPGPYLAGRAARTVAGWFGAE
ncbi:MAG: hypothetical protein HYZ75_16140 [Elusimicrobia bacterium]|nr:hypothetical protein [Elusimicrobiota bacterium]